jgi:hypothetical protein
MLIILCIAMALAATATTFAIAARYRQTRHAAREPMAQALGVREFGALDAHLEAVALDELGRLERELARYLAGRAGHVVVISKAPNGIALELSDGRRLALRGISRRTFELLHRAAPVHLLRPESFDRDAFTYRLLLRGLTGAEIKVYARNIALAA